MALSSIKFIDAALSCSAAPYSLSYADPDQKWLIKNHLNSLLQRFQTLKPSTDTYVHEDGTSVNLLNIEGYINVSSSFPPIPLTIWIHENYPSMPPIVFIMSNQEYPIRRDHPFVEPCGGSVFSPYIETWEHPRCALLGLVHNLVQIFSTDHPFVNPCDFTNSPRASLVSKLEAIDRISGNVHYDLLELHEQNSKEIDDLSILQSEMVKRADIATSILIGLEHEVSNLRRRVVDLTNEADVLSEWLKVNGTKSMKLEHDIEEDVIEGEDTESQMVIDNLAAEKGLEDLIYVLDKAAEDGVLSFEKYIKQIRVLAREQYFHKAILVKLRGPNVLN